MDEEGRPTTVPWGVIFPGESFARYPSQLYEAFLDGQVLCSILWLIHKRGRPHESCSAALSLILYGIFRIGLEFTRRPDAQPGFFLFGWIEMGRLLSPVITAFGLFIFFLHIPQLAEMPTVSTAR
jgi:phosphatidylglycerol---prolipoprotein diacylglyceryl transferase